MKMFILLLFFIVGCSRQGNLTKMPGTNVDTVTVDDISITLIKASDKIAVVDLSLSKINCDYNCANQKVSYSKNSDIVLQSNVLTGYELGTWSGCDDVVNNLCIINKITSNKTVSVSLSTSCSIGYTLSSGNCIQDVVTYQANFSAYSACPAATACSGSSTQTRTLDSCDKYINGVINSTVTNSFCAAYDTVGYLNMPCNSPAGNIVVTIANGTNTVYCSAGSTSQTIISTSCSASYMQVGNSCSLTNQNQSCSITNGTGSQSSTDGGQTFSTCAVVSCNGSYTQVGNSCSLTNQSQSCSISNGTGSQSSTDGGQTFSACTVASCNGTYTQVGNTCSLTNQSQSCSISNGTGTESSTDGGQTFGACTVASCNGTYTQVGNACSLTNQSQSCSITNGTGTQSSTDGGQSFGTCSVASCDTNYTQVGNACSLTNQSRSCVSQPSNSTGGTESSTDGGQTFGVCASFSCSNGYLVSGNSCVVDNSLILNKKISAGANYSCGINTSGNAYCWGRNYAGQLGNNSTTDSSVPVAVNTTGVLSAKTLKQISIGDSTPCVIASDDLVYCWGYGLEGQLGNGASSSSSLPVAVSRAGVLAGKTIKWVSSGYGYTCVVASDNKGYCWGYNNGGQLGNNSTSDSNIPVAVNTSGVLSGKNLLYITAGYDHACALADDYKVYCWGNNDHGQLGNDTWTQSLTPVAVNTAGVLSGKNVSFVSNYMSKSTCVLTDDNKVYCWGQNDSSQLGNNSYTDSKVPVAVNATGLLLGKTIKTVYMGLRSACVLDSLGSAYCWGNNSAGNLGHGDTNIYGTPIDVVLPGIVFNSISMGFTHACATATNGKAYCWGTNAYGEIGDNSTTDIEYPVQVFGGLSF